MALNRSASRSAARGAADVGCGAQRETPGCDAHHCMHSITLLQAEGATSRGLSFCTWTLVTLKPEVQVVADTHRDGRCAPPARLSRPFISFLCLLLHLAAARESDVADRRASMVGTHVCLSLLDEANRAQVGY